MIVRYTITPAIIAQDGDTFDVLAGYLQHKRAGIVLQSRLLSTMASIPVESQHVGSNTINTLFLEVPSMAALIAKCDDIVYDPNGAKVTVNWSDGSSNEYATRNSLLQSVADINLAIIKLMLVKSWLMRSTDGSNPTWIIGKTVQFDPSLELNQFQIGVV